MERHQHNEEKMNALKAKCHLGIKNMADILNQVRRMEAINSGKQEVELQNVSIIEVLENSLAIFEEQFLRKNIKVMKNIFVVDDYKVIAEPVSLSNQVLNNILANAIKFSERNTVLRLNIYEDKGHCIVEVLDQGIGIPQSILDNIYNPCVKTSRKGTEGENGTGFGMPLMKVFSELYTGKIEIESKTKESSLEEHASKIKLFFAKSIPEHEKKLMAS